MNKGLILSLVLVSAVEFLPAASFAGSDADTCADFVAAGDHEKAIVSGSSAIAKDPADVAGNLCLGKAYLMAGEFDKARQSLTAGAGSAVQPAERSVAATLLGELYQKTGDLNQALSQYQRALSLDREQQNPAMIGSDLDHLASLHQQMGAGNWRSRCWKSRSPTKAPTRRWEPA